MLAPMCRKEFQLYMLMKCNKRNIVTSHLKYYLAYEMEVDQLEFVYIVLIGVLEKR